MARVTVEDCIKNVEDRFELLMLAAHRARVLMSGADALVEKGKDKNDVVALREIAGGVVDVEALREEVVQSYRHETRDDSRDYRNERGDRRAENDLAEATGESVSADILAMVSPEGKGATGEEAEALEAFVTGGATGGESASEEQKADKKTPMTEATGATKKASTAKSTTSGTKTSKTKA